MQEWAVNRKSENEVLGNASGMMGRKPKRAVTRDRAGKVANRETVWLFGLHAVREALLNPRRERVRLIVTANARDRLAPEIDKSGMTPELSDARKFGAPIDAGSVHQGAALEARPLDWGTLETIQEQGVNSRVLLLDRVTDPHNVGAILRSAEVLGASAVIAPRRHSAPETGALAKAASGALEHQPYFRVGNLARAIEKLRKSGYFTIGLDETSDMEIEEAVTGFPECPVALVLGGEGTGLRPRTRKEVDQLARIPTKGGFGSLNVSNAAAIALYASQRQAG